MTTNMCETECPICMEIIDLCKNCATTECGHKFHSNCLMKSIAFNGFGCPYCRFEMVEEIVDSEADDDEADDDEADDDEADDDEADDDEAHDDETDDDEADDDEADDDDNPDQPLPSFELIQKKFIEKGITYESLVKTIMFNSLIYHKNENIDDYQKCNTFMEELFFDIVSKYEPEQEAAVKQENKEFNFYFLQDEYSQRKYQGTMKTSLEKFLDLDLDDVFNDSFLLDATTDFINNRFMEVI